MKKVTPQQLRDRLAHEKVSVLDIRSEDLFQIGHMKHDNVENIHVLKEDIFALEGSKEHTSLPFSPEQEVIVACTSGNSATRCTKILADQGYNVTLLKGGMTAWNKKVK